MPEYIDVRHLLDRRLTVELDGDSFDLDVVDWPELLRRSGALAERARGAASAAEIDALYSAAGDPVGDICEYLLGDHEDEAHAGRWQPFGVLDMRGADSYAEIDNQGVLVLDLTRAGAGSAPVLWVRDDEVTEVAPDLGALRITG